ncbi:MAG: FecR family protein [Chitinophagaceae bacterium]
MEYPDHIWNLVAKGLSKENSTAGQDELLVLLRNDPALAQQFDLLIRMWNGYGKGIPVDDLPPGIMTKILLRAEEEGPGKGLFVERFVRRSRRKFRYLLPLVSLIIIVMIGLWVFRYSGIVAGDRITGLNEQPLVTPKGSRSRFLLPDGTVVWLNAGSKLFLQNDFTGHTREVRLEGEGFFDVVKNADKPFIVHTSGINIKVLGTVFNVKAYAEDELIETTLLTGSVKVFREKETEAGAISLRQNQKLEIAKPETDRPATKQQTGAKDILPASFTITPLDSMNGAAERVETAWLYSRLEFRGDNFEKLARKMERWYNITIVFTDEEVKKLNFNGSFEKENAEQAFMALRAALPKFRYSIKNQKVEIGSARLAVTAN